MDSSIIDLREFLSVFSVQVLWCEDAPLLSCHLLGHAQGAESPLTTPISQGCRLVTLNPCLGGRGQLVEGTCQCGRGYGGRWCHLVEELADCGPPPSLQGAASHYSDSLGPYS